MRIRRVPHLVAYWRRGRLVLENYRAGVRVSAAPATLQILALLDDWHDPAALPALLPGYSRSSIARVISSR